MENLNQLHEAARQANKQRGQQLYRASQTPHPLNWLIQQTQNGNPHTQKISLTAALTTQYGKKTTKKTLQKLAQTTNATHKNRQTKKHTRRTPKLTWLTNPNSHGQNIQKLANHLPPKTTLNQPWPGWPTTPKGQNK